MTEVERIRMEGWIPEEFWKAETRCGYHVSENMKKTWAIEMDLYRELQRVCREKELRLFTDGGTTLGAIRHRGFIPWDDDIDVCLLRSDYEQLKTMHGEFKEPYFLQSVYTDSMYGYSFLRLRNCNTAVVVEPMNYCKFNQGIYMDIFPIDKVTEEDYLPRREQIKQLINKNSAFMRLNYPNKSAHDLEMIQKYYDACETPKSVFEKIEAIAMQDEHRETEYLSLIVSTQYEASHKIWPKRIFENSVPKIFESIKVDVPVGYDEQLKIYFGDYMQFPPIDQRDGWHNNQTFPEMPYKILYKKMFGIEYL